MNDTAKRELAEAREVCPTTSQGLLKEGALLVDVREPSEVAKVGFAGCEVVNIPLSEFEARWQERAARPRRHPRLCRRGTQPQGDIFPDVSGL